MSIEENPDHAFGSLFDVYHQTIETLDQQSGALFNEFKDHVECRKGCSSCCINGFKIRYIEGLNLLKGFSQAAPETAAKIIENLNDNTRLACPVLIDGACSLYEHRPSLCRAYGIILELDDTVATCNLNFQNTPDDMPLKKLDMGPYYELIDDLSQRVWAHHPMPTLSTDKSAPRFPIRKIFEAFVAFAQPPEIQQEQGTEKTAS